MTIAIVIGAYRLRAFCELNVRACRRLWPDARVLISDDRSDDSPSIEAMADNEGVSYVCSESRRSHASGDIQSFINGQVFAEQVRADVILKLSQRLIPVKPRFRELVEDPFRDPEVWLAFAPPLSGKMSVARQSAVFYIGMPILCDIVAWRPDRCSAKVILEAYRESAVRAGNRDTHAKARELFSENTWIRLVDTHFKGHAMTVPEFTNPKPFHQKIFLRKAQASEGEYKTLAEELGVEGEFPILEWKQIEKPHEYMCLPQALI